MDTKFLWFHNLKIRTLVLYRLFSFLLFISWWLSWWHSDFTLLSAFRCWLPSWLLSKQQNTPKTTERQQQSTKINYKSHFVCAWQKQNIEYKSIGMYVWCRMTSNKCVAFVLDIWCVYWNICHFARNFRHLHQMNPQNIKLRANETGIECTNTLSSTVHHTTIYCVLPFRSQWTEHFIVFRMNCVKGLRKTINFP